MAPYESQLVEADRAAQKIWVYKGLYGATLAVRPNAFPRIPAMATYAILRGRAEAVHLTDDP